MRVVNLFIGALVVAALALAALIFPAAAAFAHPPNPGYSPPAQPAGTGWRLGVNAAALNSTDPGVAPINGPAGGWSVRNMTHPALVAASGKTTRPFMLQFSEPYLSTSGFVRLRTSFSQFAVAAGSLRTYVALDNTTFIEKTCATTPWSLQADQYKLRQGFGEELVERPHLLGNFTSFKVHPTSNPNGSGWFLASNSIAQDCPYLVQITMGVRYFGDLRSYGSEDNVQADFVQNVTLLTVWDAQRWAVSTPYTGNNASLLNDTRLCDQYLPAERPSNCPPLAPDPQGSIDNLCDDAPAPAWLDFSWLGAFVSHYANCLFVPPFGFDRFQLIAPAFEASPIAAIEELLVSTAEAFVFDESCGVLVAPVPPLMLSVDTCTWSWATAFRDPLSVFVLLLGAFGILAFVVNIVIGIVSRSVPAPVKE